MREAFITKRFARKSMELITIARDILEEYRKAGYVLTLRQLYYQFVAREFLPNTPGDYHRLGNVMNDARLAGYIDWDMIEDRGRKPVSNSHWNSPADIIDQAAEQYQIDKWKGQEYYVELWAEKDAVSGILEPVCSALDILFMANRGYSSASAMYRAAKRFLAHRGQRAVSKDHTRMGKLLYFGDHDPSGIDMVRDIRDRLKLLTSGFPPDVHRIALNMDQITELNLPPNPAKLSDSRAASYVVQYGYDSWELDALDPRTLDQLARDAVLERQDDELFQERRHQEDEDKDTISDLAEGLRE